MKKINLLFIALMLLFFTIGCEKENESVNPEIEEQEQPGRCNYISDYLDSTYLSFFIDNKEFNYYNLFGGLGASIESYLNTDSVVIGFFADGEDLAGESIDLALYYKISEKELKESDTTTSLDIYKVNNFDTLIQTGNIGIRNDFIDSTNKVGAQIKYYNKNGHLITTNIDKYYEEIYQVSIPINEMDLQKTNFIIEQRMDLCDGHFLIKGTFEADIFNLSENKFYKLSKGKFRILMHH